MDLANAVIADMKRAVEAGAEVTVFADNALGLAASAKQIPSIFPAGSGPGPDTKALDTVWSDRAGFEKSAAAMGSAAEKMSAAAKSGDKASPAEQFQATGQTCGACHNSYRAKKT
jgi:cytochrome c556